MPPESDPTQEVGDEEKKTTAPTEPPAGDEVEQPPDVASADEAEDGDDQPLTRGEARKLRKESQSLRRRIRDYETADQERQQASETEAQRIERERSEIQQEREALDEERVMVAVEKVVINLSGKMGLIDPDAALRLMDWDALEFDENGPTNVEAVLRDLRSEKGYLFGKTMATVPGNTANGGSGTGNGPAPKLTADELEAAKAAGMTAERYASLKGVRTLDDWYKTRPSGG